MSEKKSGDRKTARTAIIAGLIAIALGITAIAAAPYLRSKNDTEAVAEQTESRTGNTSWQGEGSNGLVSYQGKKYSYNSHLSNYLFLGVDTKGDIMEDRDTLDAGQSDSIFLASYDRKEKTVRLLAIPRDTMTTISVYNQSGNNVGTTYDHLTLQYAYGDGREKSCKITRDAVSNLLYGVPIIGYTAINLESLPILVDTVGGVTLVVPDDSMEEVDPSFKKGAEITLTVENTEKYLRHRNTHAHQQALVRMDRQKSFINAFVDRVLELQGKDAHTITEIYETLKPHMVTNMSNDIYLDLAGAERIGSIQTIPGEGVNTELYDEYHVDDRALYELVLDVFYSEQ